MSGFKPVCEIQYICAITHPSATALQHMSVSTPVAAALVSFEAQFKKSPHTAEGLYTVQPEPEYMTITNRPVSPQFFTPDCYDF